MAGDTPVTARPAPGRLRTFALLGIVSAAAAVLTLAAGELALRAWAPVSLLTMGHRFNANAARYGWGFDPRETIVVSDPDTGATYVDRTNAAGWRDRDHAPGRAPGAFRVLVLGDSVTFGAIVGLDDLYTRVLERLLQEHGYAVEVISIGLAGWGTDLELEALRLEGLSYAPDLVVLQYTSNDASDNLEPLEKGNKPFGYQIAPTGALERRTSPSFAAAHQEDLRQLRRQRLRDRFEILKRWTLLRERLQGTARPGVQPAPGRGVAVDYVVTDWGLRVLPREFGVAEDDELLRWLRARLGQPVAEAELRQHIGASPAAPRLEEALRAFEKRWFSGTGTKRFEDLPSFTADSRSGRLLVALLDETLAETRRAGVPLVVLTTHEQGHYDWDRYWFHVGAGEALHEKYLAFNEPLRGWARARGVDLLVPEQPIERARNDPHPNRQGNRVMAETLAAYIEARYGPAIRLRTAVAAR